MDVKVDMMQYIVPRALQARVMDKLHSIQGPSADLPPRKFELKKFLANTRLYIGNIAGEVPESEIKDLFQAFGEVDEVFINREKNFAFLKLVSWAPFHYS